MPSVRRSVFDSHAKPPPNAMRGAVRPELGATETDTTRKVHIEYECLAGMLSARVSLVALFFFCLRIVSLFLLSRILNHGGFFSFWIVCTFRWMSSDMFSPSELERGMGWIASLSNSIQKRVFSTLDAVDRCPNKFDLIIHNIADFLIKVKPLQCTHIDTGSAHFGSHCIH